jgi:putative addiction module component (TIGR02574 family)
VDQLCWRTYNSGMTQRAQQLLREVLTLPAEERADMAAELLASLDGPSPDDQKAVQAAWAHEIERRARRVMAGESAGTRWEEARERITRRLSEQ